jgi:hypothetical protein
MSKEDADALKKLKKLRSKTTVAHLKKKLIEELVETPQKMEKIINTWAGLRAKRLTPLPPEDTRAFNRLKTRYIKHVKEKK